MSWLQSFQRWYDSNLTLAIQWFNRLYDRGSWRKLIVNIVMVPTIALLVIIGLPVVLLGCTLKSLGVKHDYYDPEDV